MTAAPDSGADADPDADPDARAGTGAGPDARADPDVGSGPASILFTYGAPFLGVLLVAVGIAAAVPGAYALVQEDLAGCGDPTIAVESSAETDRRFGDGPPATLDRLPFAALSPAERTAVETALADPTGEARVRGAFPNAGSFRNGTLVTVEGERHYATVVANNTCFRAAPLQFPLGVFAVALGVVGILTPPAYRTLVALETGDGSERGRESESESESERGRESESESESGSGPG